MEKEEKEDAKMKLWEQEKDQNKEREEKKSDEKTSIRMRETNIEGKPEEWQKCERREDITVIEEKSKNMEKKSSKSQREIERKKGRSDEWNKQEEKEDGK